MTLAVLLILVALACGIVLAVHAVLQRSSETGLVAAAAIALGWAGLLLAGVRLP